MTGHSLQRFQHRVAERRAMLLRQVSQTEDELRLLDTDVPPEIEEDAQEARLADVLASLDGRSKAEIAAIERALALVDAGDYGICEDCGEDIPIARLDALPAATRCVTCAEARETALRSRSANENGHRPTSGVATLWDTDDSAE